MWRQRSSRPGWSLCVALFSRAWKLPSSPVQAQVVWANCDYRAGSPEPPSWLPWPAQGDEKENYKTCIAIIPGFILKHSNVTCFTFKQDMFDFKVRSLAESFLGGGTMKDNLLLHWEISPKVKNEITKTKRSTSRYRAPPVAEIGRNFIILFRQKPKPNFSHFNVMV